MSGCVETVGRCEQRLFGLMAAERLGRQRSDEPGPILLADASVVLSDETVAWLLENPGTVLTTPAGRPAAVAVEPGMEASGRAALKGEGALPSINPATVPDKFVRKLRRRSKLFVRSLDEEPRAKVERELFGIVYKGITDLVTKFVWPWPAYWVTKLCASGRVHPNAVTIFGMGCMAVAAVLWAQGELALGLLFAWVMTFLDTVDGKLARVTVTSSPLGNKLDHVTDVVHPPIWWVCLAAGIATISPPSVHDELILSCVLILIAYVLGRAIESMFKKTIGYNAFLWQPFDSHFRLVVARRNIILLIITVGILLGRTVEAYAVSAAWSLLSVAIQAVRFLQARHALRSGNANSWLM